MTPPACLIRVTRPAIAASSVLSATSAASRPLAPAAGLSLRPAAARLEERLAVARVCFLVAIVRIFQDARERRRQVWRPYSVLVYSLGNERSPRRHLAGAGRG